MNTKILNVVAWLSLLVMQVAVLFLLQAQRKEQEELKTSLVEWRSSCVEQLAAIQGIDGDFDRLENLLKDRLNRSSALCEKALRSNPTKTRTVQAQGVDLDRLSRVWIMPYPPLNRGRFLSFASYSIQKNGDGSETVVFEEWNGSSLVQTSIPAKEVRWNVGR